MYNSEDKKAAAKQRLIAFSAIIWIAAAWVFRDGIFTIFTKLERAYVLIQFLKESTRQKVGKRKKNA